MKQFPVLVSIPHGGSKIPDELRNLTCLTKSDIFDDSDAFTLEIFNIGSKAAEVVTTDIARAFVDVNRAPDDRPPVNPDGVVKTQTCYNAPVYKNESDPDKNLTDTLLNRYYKPYHKSIQRAIQSSKIKLALDCHSMAESGPPISPDSGQKRPEFCMGNIHGVSSSMDIVGKFADCVKNVFSLNDKDVVLNSPFAGGYITKTYGLKPVPWIQVEMNRKLYLSSQWYNRETFTINGGRLKELNLKFLQVLELYFA